MNTFQKVIKYVAMTIAVLLTVVILGGIVGLVSTVISVFDGEEGEFIDYSMNYSNVEQLDIKNGLGSLTIKSGDEFRVEATNVSENFTAEVNNGILTIDDKKNFNRFISFGFSRINTKSNITIYVPDNYNAKKIKIDSGAGEVTLEDFSTDILIIDAGVGDIKGKNLSAKKVDVSGGMGDINLLDVNFSDVDFDSGVGSLKIEGFIFGNSKFDCGVGNVRLKLKGNREDYVLRVNSGIGTIRVNGKKLSSNYNDNYGAENTLRISGGVGKVDIEFTP